MKGTPTMFLTSDRRALEGQLDPYTADTYLNGKPCEIIGKAMRLSEGEEVTIYDCLVKIVLAKGFKVYIN